MSYGITPTGFVRKTLQDIKTSLEESWRVAFGQDSDLSEDSPNSILIGLMASAADEQWQLTEDVYHSQNPNSADDVSLDDSAQLVGITRLPASSSLANCSFKGDNAITIPIGTQVSQSSTNKVFETIREFLLLQNDANSIDMQIDTLTDATSYNIIINGVSYKYLTTTNPTYDEIVNALKSIIDGAGIGVTLTNNSDGAFNIESDDLSDTNEYLHSGNILIEKIQVISEVKAIEVGEIPVPASTIDTIDTPIAGLDSVFNHIDGNIGSIVETDAELRLRRERDIFIAGASNVDAIRAKLNQEVEGLSFVRVYENDTLEVDIDGIQPKSIEAVCEGGSDFDIANTLFGRKVGGIPASGNESEIVYDSKGFPHIIKFSRPTPKYIWVDVVVDAYNPEEDFPVDGEDAIKTNIVDFGSEEFGIGIDVLLQKLYEPIYKVRGVGEVTLQIAITDEPTDTPSYGTANIVLNIREKSNFDTSRITVALP